MSLLSKMSIWQHEQVLYNFDERSGCRAIIAIHNTALGPALGGCRFVDYAHEEAALDDVLRLSRGMTYKAALARLPLGGGKSVIIGDHQHLRSREFFRAFGSFVHSFGGRYITSVDMNTTEKDMDWVKEVTPYVTASSQCMGGAGNPSLTTALGVFQGLKEAVRHLWQQEDFQGLRVAVQGVGAVGAELCRLLAEHHAQLHIADVRPERLKYLAQRYGATITSPQQIHQADVDIFAPCAFGGSLNERSIPQIKARLVGGGANNQLAEEDSDGKRLADAGILYCPDYVMNAGGLIHVYHELIGYQSQAVEAHVARIPETLQAIFAKMEQEKLLPQEASNRVAQEFIAQASAGQHPFHHMYGAHSWSKKPYEQQWSQSS